MNWLPTISIAIVTAIFGYWCGQRDERNRIAKLEIDHVFKRAKRALEKGFK